MPIAKKVAVPWKDTYFVCRKKSGKGLFKLIILFVLCGFKNKTNQKLHESLRSVKALKALCVKVNATTNKFIETAFLPINTNISTPSTTTFIISAT